jgi:hypothetical protein
MCDFICLKKQEIAGGVRDEHDFAALRPRNANPGLRFARPAGVNLGFKRSLQHAD